MSEITKPLYKKGKNTGIIVRVVNDKRSVVVHPGSSGCAIGHEVFTTVGKWSIVDFEEKTEPSKSLSFSQIADKIESMTQEILDPFQRFGDEKVVSVTESWPLEFDATKLEERASRMEYLHHIQNWKDTKTSSEPKELVQETLHPSFGYDTVSATSHLLGANKF